jgi:hypothetical protein
MSKRTQIFTLGFLFLVCFAAALVQFWQQRQRQQLRPNDLVDVIMRQVDAFRADDYATAYQQVSTGFQEKFNIESFTELARSEYPLLAQAERKEFGPVHWDGRHAILPVYFFLQDGTVVPCLYSLIQEDAVWKIDGLRVQKRWPAGRRLGGMRA